VSGRRAGPATLLVYATRSGGTTLDTGEGGGNPFASALIEAAEPPGLPLRELPKRLRTRTAELSGGHQAVEWLGETARGAWRFPVGEGFAHGQLRRYGVSVTQLVGAACARAHNLVFFAGCRTLVPSGTAPDLSRAPR